MTTEQLNDLSSIPRDGRTVMVVLSDAIMISKIQTAKVYHDGTYTVGTHIFDDIDDPDEESPSLLGWFEMPDQMKQFDVR